jgi:hypothetical protein
VHIRPIIEEHKQKMFGLKQDIARYIELGELPQKTLQEEFTRGRKDRDIDYTPEM